MGIKKGANSEREMSKFLSLWASEGEHDDWIWRTAGSGARATQRTKQGLSTYNSYGDFFALNPIAQPLFDLAVWENKKGYTKETEIISLIDKSKRKKEHILIEWSKKNEKTRRESGAYESFIIVERDRRKPFILVSDRLLHTAQTFVGYYINPMIVFSDAVTGIRLNILNLEDFLTYLSFEDVKEILNMYREGKA